MGDKSNRFHWQSEPVPTDSPGKVYGRLVINIVIAYFLTYSVYHAVSMVMHSVTGGHSTPAVTNDLSAQKFNRAKERPDDSNDAIIDVRKYDDV